jgi:hypothetical protein
MYALSDCDTTLRVTDLGGDVRAGDEVCVKMALDSKSCDEQVFAEVRALNQARCLGTHPVRPPYSPTILP